MSQLNITVGTGSVQVVQLGTLSAAVNQQITQAVATSTASASTATEAAATATSEANAAAASANAAATSAEAAASGAPAVAAVQAANESTSSATSVGTVILKALQRNATVWAFEGDSLTYGQDTSATGTGPAINGFGTSRTPYPFPEQFGQSMNLTYPELTIVNRGCPGDSVVQGLSRWATAAPVDVCFLMYGHNDANNYGTHGVVPVPQFVSIYHQLIDRRLAQGAAVVVLLPMDVQDAVQNLNIRAYAEAARKIAAERGLLCIDTQQFLDFYAPTINQWTDGVHLSELCYNDIGWNLAAVFADARGLDQKRITAATQAFPQSGYFVMGDQTIGSPNSENNFLIRVVPGGTTILTGYFEDSLIPVLSLANPEGTAGVQLGYWYAGGIPFGIKQCPFTGQATTHFQQVELPAVAAGYRSLIFRNTGSANVYIESLKFRVPDAATSIQHTTPANLLRKSTLAGLSTLGNGGWYGIADTSTYLTGNWTVIADVTLNTGPNSESCGISIVGDGIFNAADYLSNVQMIFARQGTALGFLFLGGTPPANVANVFPSATATWSGEVRLTYSATAGTLTLAVNGVTVVTLSGATLPFVTGNVALISTGAAVSKASGMTIYIPA